MGPIAALIVQTAITAGISAIQKRRAQKEANKPNRIDFRQMRADAEAGGFNPVLALRAGAFGAYQYSTAKYGGTDIALDILGAGMKAAMNYDPFANQRSQLQIDLLQSEVALNNAQIAGLQGVHRTAAGPGAVRPTAGAKTIGAPPMAGAVTLPTISDVGAYQPMEQGRRTVSNPYTDYIGWKPNPWFPDGEVWEARLGEVGGSVASTATNLPADIIYNTWRDLKKIYWSAGHAQAKHAKQSDPEWFANQTP